MLAFEDLVPSVVTAIETQSSKPVGNHRVPGSVQDTPAAPFAIVYHVGGEREDTAYGFAHDMAWVTVQVTSVGETAKQANWMADQARDAILGKTGGSYNQALSPAGLNVCGRSLEDIAVTTFEEGVWQTTERFRLLVTE